MLIYFCMHAVLAGDPVLQAVRQAQRRRQVLSAEDVCVLES